MGRQYRERRDVAKEDIAKWCDKHVMVEEPVRSFRFHAHYVKKTYSKGNETRRPGFITFTPVEGAQFQYTSTYAFTLTWTPGHMTIVGDLGELVVVHYHAMPTLEEACNWLQTPDFDYLLSKTKQKREFDRDQTVKDIWDMISEEATQHLKYYQEELARHEAEKPKWRKRDGMTKADFEAEMKSWEGDHPRHSYGFTKCSQPDYLNRNLWSESQKIGWDIPDGFDLVARAWHSLRDESYCSITDPNDLLAEDGLEELHSDIDSFCRDSGEEDIQYWCYHTLDRDWSGTYEYPQHAFFQIAAIQFGCQMILQQLKKEEQK